VRLKNFLSGPGRVHIGQMQSVAVSPTGRIKSAPVVVNRTRAVNDFVATVVVNVADCEVMISLPFLREIARCAVARVERPAAC
jgi:hypothetical protein